MKGMANEIRKFIIKIIGLPHTAQNAYLYSAMQDKGFGPVALSDEYALQSIDHCFQMFTCRNQVITRIALDNLLQAVQQA